MICHIIALLDMERQYEWDNIHGMHVQCEQGQELV